MLNPSSVQSREDSVYDRPLHLAGVLDNAADELNQTWFGYEWNDRTRCNCGIVARHVLQTTTAELRKQLPPIYVDGNFTPTWREMTQTYCAESGLTKNEVFSRLFAAGLRTEDFGHLEDLSHPEILAQMTPYRRETVAVRRSRKSDVIAYLRAWAAGIEVFRDNDRVMRVSETAEVA
jgi:hypothetical protein